MASLIPDEPSEDLMEQIPEDIQAKLDSLLDSEEKTRIAISSDMKVDGTYGGCWLLATDKRVITFSPNGSEPLAVTQVALGEITSIKPRYFIGNGILEIRTADRAIPSLRFSRSLADKVDNAARAIEKLMEENGYVMEAGAKKLRDKPPSGRRKHRCEQCGRVLPYWSETCPYCLKKRRLVFRLLSYLKPYWPLAAAGTVLTLLNTGVGLVPTYLQRPLMDRVFAPVVPTPAEERLHLLVVLVLALIGLHVTSTGLGTIRNYVTTWLGGRIVFNLRTQAYEHLQKLSLGFYNKKETGRLISRVSYDTSHLQGFIVESLQELIMDILMLSGMSIILFSMNWQLAALTLLPLPIVIMTSRIFGRKMHRVYHKLWKRWAGISAILADTIPGVKVVKAFTGEGREIGRFNDRSAEVFESSIYAAKLGMMYYPLMGFMMFAGGIIVRWFGGRGVILETLTLGELMVFMGYMYQFYGPIQGLARLNMTLQQAAAAAERVFEIMDTEPEVGELKDAISLPRIEGNIRFDNVTFSYDSEKNVLENVSFEVKAGEMIGLSGPSGAGKSTLINLVCRFYDVTGGFITVDGHDIRDIELRSLREQIGVVLQDTFLFHGTIAANIAYGRPDATREEIIAAAKAANAHDFIADFPDGYDSQVGERGVRLSGGERQRIAIARAILKNPRILILDEATSSVDTETESLIQEAVERLVEGRTTFAIAHRLSTLRRADRLLIFDKGGLVESGTHEELLQRDGLYKHLVDLQSQLSKLTALGG